MAGIQTSSSDQAPASSSSCCADGLAVNSIWECGRGGWACGRGGGGGGWAGGRQAESIYIELARPSPYIIQKRGNTFLLEAEERKGQETKS